MICQSKKIMEKIEKLFMKEDYSDCTIQIIQAPTCNFENKTIRKRKLGKNYNCTSTDENIIHSIPAHLIVLTSQSEYFEKSFQWLSKENTDGKIFKLVIEEDKINYSLQFIECFYRHNMFKDLTVSCALHLLELANHFLCDPIIENALEYLPSLKIQDLEECSHLATKMNKENYEFPFMQRAVAIVTKSCSNYISDMFGPLETNYFNKKTEFENIPLDLLLLVLKNPNCKLCYHENSLLYFVVKWLEFDKSRQISKTIELLLQEISYEDLTALFLVDVITIDQPILLKCKNFREWYLSALAYFATENVRPMPLGKRKKIYYDRNFKAKNDIITSRHRLLKATNEFSTDGYFVYKGYEISPRLNYQRRQDFFRLYINFEFKNVCDYKIKTGVIDSIKVLDFSFVVKCQRSSEENIDGIEMEFESAGAYNSDFGNVSYAIMESGDHTCSCHIGSIQEYCIENWDGIDICLGITDDDGAWPNSFPEHFHSDDGDHYMRLGW